MRETVLLINFQEPKQLREIKMILFTLKVRMKTVEKAEYLQTVGFLAGVKEKEPEEKIYEGDDLGQEMMVFAGVPNNKLEQILFLIRKSGTKRVDYKAVLTETNQEWTVLELYEELAKEHEQMHKKQ